MPGDAKREKNVAVEREQNVPGGASRFFWGFAAVAPPASGWIGEERANFWIRAGTVFKFPHFPHAANLVGGLNELVGAMGRALGGSRRHSLAIKCP